MVRRCHLVVADQMTWARMLIALTPVAALVVGEEAVVVVVEM